MLIYGNECYIVIVIYLPFKHKQCLILFNCMQKKSTVTSWSVQRNSHQIGGNRKRQFVGVNKYSTASIKTRWKLSWGKTTFKLLGINFHIELDQMQQLNFNEKIQKIRSLIKLWNRRYLTPLGKITVIKTLLLPKLNHLFISIPNP